jgi:hypothetical protein
MQLFGIVLAAVLTTAAVAWGGFALASGPTANKYYACAKNNAISGAIKVNTRPTCPAGQKLVVWNQVGPKGATGATRAAGPANLSAMQSLACNVNGVAGALYVAVDPTSGAVSMVCQRGDRANINVAVAGGTIDGIALAHNFVPEDTCSNADACSFHALPGDHQLVLQSSLSFTIKCPGEGAHQAAPSGGIWVAQCFDDNYVGTGQHNVSVTIL